jgi:hypothetical protein
VGLASILLMLKHFTLGSAQVSGNFLLWQFLLSPNKRKYTVFSGASAVRAANLNPQHFPRELAAAFAVAIAGDRDQILRTVQNGSNEVGRLYRLGIELSNLSHAQGPGGRAGGWILSLPDQATADTQRAAHLGP